MAPHHVFQKVVSKKVLSFSKSLFNLFQNNMFSFKRWATQQSMNPFNVMISFYTP